MNDLMTAMIAYRSLVNRKLALEADPDHDPGDHELAVFLLGLVDEYLERAFDMQEREFYLEP